MVGFLIANYFIFLFFSKGIEFDFNNLNIASKDLLDPKLISFSLIYALSIVLEGIISSNLKAKLLFFRINNPLPGFRAFSVIAEDDPRIDSKALKKLYPKGIPKTPDQENAEWYKLYRKHSTSQTVLEAHKAFLLTRDLASLTLLLIPISIVFHIIIGVQVIAILTNILLLVFIFFACAFSSRNYGGNFVANVIVEEIQKLK